MDDEMPPVSKFIKDKLPTKEINIPKVHKKSGISNFSDKNELTISENNYLKFPPTPPSQLKKPPPNSVDRQKAIIK